MITICKHYQYCIKTIKLLKEIWNMHIYSLIIWYEWKFKIKSTSFFNRNKDDMITIQQSFPFLFDIKDSFLSILYILLQVSRDKPSILSIPSYHWTRTIEANGLSPKSMCFHTWSNSKCLTDTIKYLHNLSLTFSSIDYSFCRVQWDIWKLLPSTDKVNK